MVLGEVAWIYADLLCHGGGGQGCIGIEVDVGHQGSGDAFCAEAGLDGGQRLYLFQALCGEADNVAARGGQGAALGHAGFYVKGVGVAHRLHGNGMAVAYDYAAYVAGNVFHQNL